MTIQEGLTFSDLLLVPKYSDIESRKEVHIGGQLFPLYLKMPLIASPMDTICETKMAEAMAKNGGLGIVHRYCSIEEQTKMIVDMEDCYVGAAVGVVGDFLERTQELIKIGVNVICIDIAHGHSFLMKEALAKINKLPNRDGLHVMAGNVATGEAYFDLAEWGADSIRVGVGGGSICSTRLQTGFGVPNMSAIFDCVNTWNKHSGKEIKRPSLIIDGGIKTAGDIVKALAAGADFCMLGSLLAGTDEAPGEILENDSGNRSKIYRGMASREAMKSGGKSAAPEGISTIIPHKGPLQPILDDLKGNIASGFSYAGARNIEELRKNAHFIKQTTAGQHESFTHILSK